MTLRHGLTAVVVVALALTGTARAQDDKANKELDQKIADSLKEVINTGADRFNQLKDYAGCYRLYEGALMMTRPFLAHRAALQKDIDAALAEADKTPLVHDKAFALRRVIDKVRGECDPKAKQPPPNKTLWDRLGGEPNVKKVIDDFVEAAAKDAKVDFFRGKNVDVKTVANLKKQLLDQFSSLTGGPYQYTGKSMKDAHKGMGITSEQFDALADHLKAALEKNKAAPEDVKIVMDAVGKTKPDIVEAKKLPTPMTKSLWERMGGEPTVKKVVEDVLPVIVADKTIDFTRGSKVKLDDQQMAQLKTDLVAFLSQVSGGPTKYQGKSPKEVFKDMEVTDAQYKAAEDHLKKALTDNKVNAAEVTELLTEIGKFKTDIVQKK